MANKELFHSNFLAWLAENNETRHIFVKAIQSLSKKKVPWAEDFLNNSGKFLVKREYEHFDLCILQKISQNNKNGKIKKDVQLPVFVLENKNKSLPDDNQLKGYEGTVKKIWSKWGKKDDKNSITYLLLSLAIDFPDKEKIEEEQTWSICSYGDLARALVPPITINTYYYYLINDYIQFISILHNLSQKWLKIQTYLMPDEEREQLNECRLYDICDKIRHSRFVSIYKDKYQDEITSFFSNGAGLEWSCKKNEVEIVIQIQDGQYRHAVKCEATASKIGKNNDERNEKGKEVIKKAGVTDFLKICEDAKAFMPNNNNVFVDNVIYPNKKGNLFNIFEKTGKNGYVMLYQYKKIEPKVSIEDVLDYLHKEIDSLKKILSHNYFKKTI